MELKAIQSAENRVPRPAWGIENSQRLSSWVDESIWGHRLWHRQTPWLIFLEFLGAAEAGFRDNRLFQMSNSSSDGYQMHQRLALRNIIFNKEADICFIAESAKADSQKWEEWIKKMNEESLPPGQDYSYLQKNFGRFSELKTTVGLLRQTAIEPESNRRWSSRFLFPFGALALYEDVNIKSGKVSREYINLGRSGEILYLMLSRSSHHNELAAEFKAFFEKTTIQTRMLAKLIPNKDNYDLASVRDGAYLPYKTHPSYDRLAEDWLSILRLKLPAHDAFAHLVPLGALHMLIYLLETAAVHLNKEAPFYVCEVIAPKMEFVRQKAVKSYLANDGLPWGAVERVVDTFFESEFWKTKMSGSDLVSDADRVEAGTQLLSTEFGFKAEELGNCENLAMLREAILEKLRDKHNANWSGIHSAYGRHCGLVSKRNAGRYRYAPTDGLLKTLVLATVQKRMEIGEFLALLFNRYRFVFGPAEASKALSANDYDEPAFGKNRARLEERLRSMGFLNRLSDGCAYVENPLHP